MTEHQLRALAEWRERLAERAAVWITPEQLARITDWRRDLDAPRGYRRPWEVDAEEIARDLTVLAERADGATWRDVARRAGPAGGRLSAKRTQERARRLRIWLTIDPGPARRMIAVLTAITSATACNVGPHAD